MYAIRSYYASVATMPNLIEVQKNSYDQFLQIGTPLAQRQDSGLQEVFKSVFPIKDFTGRGSGEGGIRIV